MKKEFREAVEYLEREYAMFDRMAVDSEGYDSEDFWAWRFHNSSPSQCNRQMIEVMDIDRGTNCSETEVTDTCEDGSTWTAQGCRCFIQPVVQFLDTPPNIDKWVQTGNLSYLWTGVEHARDTPYRLFRANGMKNTLITWADVQ